MDHVGTIDFSYLSANSAVDPSTSCGTSNIHSTGRCLGLLGAGSPMLTTVVSLAALGPSLTVVPNTSTALPSILVSTVGVLLLIIIFDDFG